MYFLKHFVFGKNELCFISFSRLYYRPVRQPSVSAGNGGMQPLGPVWVEELQCGVGLRSDVFLSPLAAHRSNTLYVSLSLSADMFMLLGFRWPTPESQLSPISTNTTTGMV